VRSDEHDIREDGEYFGGNDAQVDCHGGLYAHNIERDMFSHWEAMSFLSIWP
jgi:hypothetical protein